MTALPAGLRARRRPLAALGVLVLGALVVALTLGGDGGGTLDPNSASPDGGRALASLLRERGVTVTPARTTAEALTAVRDASGEATLLVTDPGLLTRLQLDTLAATPVARLVVVQPDAAAVDLLTTARTTVEPSPEGGGPVDPACPDADATSAGNTDIGDGEVFSGVSGPAAGCYATAEGYALLTATGPASAQTVLVGSRTPFRNDRLAEHGNAALALRLLGKHPTVVWYLPDSADPGASASGPKSFTEVLPAGWRWGALALVPAVGLLALWQARRLGPVVAEPMPVAVRAAETVEGRARLYERGRVTDRAAATLREATRSRLAARLGLPRTAGVADVAAAIAARGGPAAAQTMAVLAGPAPADDAALVAAASALDRLEAEVGRL